VRSSIRNKALQYDAPELACFFSDEVMLRESWSIGEDGRDEQPVETHLGSHTRIHVPLSASHIGSPCMF
jgi:hypothetical protein